MVVMAATRGFDIGRRLRELRRERALTQKELSELSGVHPVTISDLEREQTNASAKNTRKLAAGLGVSEGPYGRRSNRRPQAQSPRFQGRGNGRASN